MIDAMHTTYGPTIEGLLFTQQKVSDERTSHLIYSILKIKLVINTEGNKGYMYKIYGFWNQVMLSNHAMFFHANYDIFPLPGVLPWYGTSETFWNVKPTGAQLGNFERGGAQVYL